MARARNIKPSFFENEELVECSFAARLCFIGLWTLADREGRLEDRPRRIKMALFPGDDVQVDELLEELSRVGLIVRYQSGGMCLITIPKFTKHQRPHQNESASELPAPDQGVDCSASHHGEKDGEPRETALRPESPSLNPECGTPKGTSPNGDESAAGPPSCPQEEIKKIYAEVCVPAGMPAVRVWNEQRQRLLRARWREDSKHQSLDFWRQYLQYAAQSSFLTGKVEPSGDRPPFCADLEWLVRPKNFAKVIEGKYHRE